MKGDPFPDNSRSFDLKRENSVLQIRIHGRGGQGVVTAAEILSISAFLDGKYAQAFPSFGSERMGAPVTAFCRIDEKEIRLREPVSEPDALIIQDTTLLHHVDLFSGLKSTGTVLINSTRSLEELRIEVLLTRFPSERLWTVPASEIARRHLGRPMPNAALIGGFAAITGRIRLASVQKAICEKFHGRIGDANASAAAEAYDSVESRLKPA